MTIRKSVAVTRVVTLTESLELDIYGNVYKDGKLLSKYADRDGYNVVYVKSVSIRIHLLVAYRKYGSPALYQKTEVRHLNGDKLDNSWDNIAIGSRTDNRRDMPAELRIKIASNAGKGNSKNYTHEQLSERQRMRTLSVPLSNRGGKTKKGWEKVDVEARSAKFRLNYSNRSREEIQRSEQLRKALRQWPIVPEEISEIRRLYATGAYSYVMLADLFAVSSAVISKIIRRKGKYDIG